MDSVSNMLSALVNDLLEIFKDLFFWSFTKFFEFCIWLGSYVVGLLPTFDPSSHWNSLPSDVVNLLSYLHFGQCLTIVIGAIVIRFGLNFFPFFK